MIPWQIAAALSHVDDLGHDIAQPSFHVLQLGLQVSAFASQLLSLASQLLTLSVPCPPGIPQVGQKGRVMSCGRLFGIQVASIPASLKEQLVAQGTHKSVGIYVEDLHVGRLIVSAVNTENHVV